MQDAQQSTHYYTSTNTRTHELAHSRPLHTRRLKCNESFSSFSNFTKCLTAARALFATLVGIIPTLQCVAVHCSVLQCVAVCCSVSHYVNSVAQYINRQIRSISKQWDGHGMPTLPPVLCHRIDTLRHTATHCNTLQCTATQNSGMDMGWTLELTHCDTLQHTATHCNTLRHTATHCITACGSPWHWPVQ